MELRTACEQNDLAAVRRYVHPFWVNAKCSNGIAPLHIATSNENVEIIKVLLECPEIVSNEHTSDCRKPIHIAVEKGNYEIVRLFVEHHFSRDGIKDNKEIASILGWAVYEENYELLNFLFENYKEIDINAVDYNDQTPIFHAIAQEKLKVIEIICKAFEKKALEGRAQEINLITPSTIFGGGTVMHYLLRMKNEKFVVEFFRLCFSYANNNGNDDIYKIKLRTVIKDYKGNTIIHLAAYKGYIGLIKALLKYKKYRNLVINEINDNGCTALKIAYRNTGIEEKKALYYELCGVLLDYGAEPSISSLSEEDLQKIRENLTPDVKGAF